MGFRKTLFYSFIWTRNLWIESFELFFALLTHWWRTDLSFISIQWKSLCVLFLLSIINIEKSIKSHLLINNVLNKLQNN